MDEQIPGTSRMSLTEAAIRESERMDFERKRKAEERREKDRERKRRKKAEESEEQTQRRRISDAERHRRQMDEMTEEQRQQRMVSDAERHQRQTAEMSEEQRQERRISRRDRYENLSEDMRQMQIHRTQDRTQERVRIQRIQSRFIGRRREMPPRNYLGPMDKVCQHCQARFWLCEKTGGSKAEPSFNRCCSQGDIALPPLEVMPQLLQQLFDGNDGKAKEFRKNIRAYNSLLSFTSCGAKFDESMLCGSRGIFTYRIHGGMYHLMGSLLPSPKINQP